MKKKFTYLAITIGVIVTALAIVAATYPQFENKQSCYALISAVDPNSDEQSQILEYHCYDTFAESISAATQGRVKLDKNVQPWDVTNDMLNSTNDYSILSPNTTNVIGIDWLNDNGQGQGLTWTTTTSGCSSSNSFNSSPMPAGWDNVVSSAAAYANCNHYYHYENTDYGGSVLDCGTYCGTMGVMNNQTSSEKWHQ